MTKVVGYVDIQIVVYPNKEINNLTTEDYERAAIEGLMEVYYSIYEDLEEISND